MINVSNVPNSYRHSFVTTHVSISIRQHTDTWVLLAYHRIICTYAFTISSVSLIHLHVTIWTLPHKCKYIIGCNISISPYKLLSLTLNILTTLTTIACHSAHHLHSSVSYTIVLCACTSCICKVILNRISCASTTNNDICCIIKESTNIYA